VPLYNISNLGTKSGNLVDGGGGVSLSIKIEPGPGLADQAKGSLLALKRKVDEGRSIS